MTLHDYIASLLPVNHVPADIGTWLRSQSPLKGVELDEAIAQRNAEMKLIRDQNGDYLLKYMNGEVTVELDPRLEGLKRSAKENWIEDHADEIREWYHSHCGSAAQVRFGVNWTTLRKIVVKEPVYPRPYKHQEADNV